MSNSIDCKLQFFKRFKEINDDYCSRFAIIAKGYEEQINSGAFVKEIGFTPHEYPHCNSIFNLAGLVLPEKFYQQEGDNIFVLAIAVLFHDWSMSIVQTEDARKRHSDKSNEMLIDEYLSKANTVLKIFTPDNDMKTPVAQIIRAHSDVKETNGDVSVKTFEALLNDYDSKQLLYRGKYEEINVPFLAAILRLCDELDIDSNRVKNTDYGRKYKSATSEEHFILCELFNKPSYDKVRNPTYISLHVDEDKFGRLDEVEQIQAAGTILARYEKIKTEFEFLKSRVLFNSKWTYEDWRIERIMLLDEEKFRVLAQKKKR